MSSVMHASYNLLWRLVEAFLTKLDQETGYIIIISLFHHLPVF